MIKTQEFFLKILHVLPRPVRYWFQRRLRGFDDSDLWGLNYTILKFILPRLKAFREHSSYSTPIYFFWDGLTADEFFGLPEEKQEEITDGGNQRWKEALDKMIRAVELHLEYDGVFPRWEPREPTFEELKNATGLIPDGFTLENDDDLEAEFEEGWALFQEHFFSLWD